MSLHWAVDHQVWNDGWTIWTENNLVNSYFPLSLDMICEGWMSWGLFFDGTLIDNENSPTSNIYTMYFWPCNCNSMLLILQIFKILNHLKRYLKEYFYIINIDFFKKLIMSLYWNQFTCNMYVFMNA